MPRLLPRERDASRFSPLSVLCKVEPFQLQLLNAVSGGGFDVGIGDGAVADVEGPKRARSEGRRPLCRAAGNVFGDRQCELGIHVDNGLLNGVHGKGWAARLEFPQR